jgi:glycerol-3-phosphate dehydrogenase subunit B
VSEVVVVGAGIAGLAAALAAKAEGARVTVLDGHPGASTLAGGVWDLAASRTPADDAFFDVRSSAHALVDVVRARPTHPLAPLGEALRTVAFEAHRAVLDALAIYAPLELDRPRALVVTDAGLVRRTATAQRGVLDLSELPTGRVAVATFPAARAHDGAFVAASLSELVVRAGDARRFCAVEVEMLRRGRDVWLHPHEAGALFDDDRARDRLVRALARALGGMSFDAVLIPPLLGEHDDTAWARVRAALALPIGEWASSLAGPQSARLVRALTRAFARSGAHYERSRVRAARASERELAVETERTTHKAGALVLATGRHLAGGLSFAEGVPREPLFDLPAFVDGAPVAASPDPRALFGDDPFDDAPGFRAGVGVDAEMRVLERVGVARPGLFAAGSVLAGVPVVGEGGGLGVAAITGWIAGRNAARHAARA